MDTMGDRIRQARKQAGLTQSELAEKIGVKFAAVHKYEAGLVVNLRRETIEKLAEVLDVKPSWLMCLDEEGSEESDILQALHDVPGLRIMFDVSRNRSDADIMQAVEIIKAFYRTKDGDEK